MMKADALFAALWDHYASLTPQAEKIRSLLEARGERVVNDHVAFRTFDHERLGIDRLARPFLQAGYTPQDTYRFEEKKLFARYYAHENPELPKVFISELLLDQFSDPLRETVDDLVDQLPEEVTESPELVTAGRQWPVDKATYERLAAESEYAGWMAAFGFCANHFTVFFNKLETFEELEELARFIEAEGFTMNASGGLIKGGRDVLLEQCSTKATQVPVTFSDGEMTIPSCYYEFARRYPGPDGKLYQGFVAASADKIFESTDR
jgi:hypothetical protein